MNGGSPRDAFRGHGWDAIEIDGHNHEDIELALSAKPVKPFVVVAETIKGKGVSFFEDHLLYHYKHVTLEEYGKCVAELNDEELYKNNVLALHQ